jgi:hypothetical protein
MAARIAFESSMPSSGMAPKSETEILSGLSVNLSESLFCEIPAEMRRNKLKKVNNDRIIFSDINGTNSESDHAAAPKTVLQPDPVTRTPLIPSFS